MNKEEMFEQILAMTYEIGKHSLNNTEDRLTYKELEEIYYLTKKQYIEMLEERK